MFLEMQVDMKIMPDEFKPESAGAELWQWLEAEVEEIERARPLALELCRIAQRLSDIRAKLAVQGLTVAGVRGRSVRNPLMDSELRLSAQYAKLWRALGLSVAAPGDATKPARPVGRPSTEVADEKLWRD
jgi:hypothetical protein